MPKKSFTALHDVGVIYVGVRDAIDQDQPPLAVFGSKSYRGDVREVAARAARAV
jgi:hypothetical protein